VAAEIDLDQCNVGGGIGPEDSALLFALVGEAELDRLRVADHVLVRDDVALIVEHEAGARGVARLDLDDGGLGAAVDVAGRQPSARLAGRARDDRGGGRGRRGVVIVQEHHRAGCDEPTQDRREEQRDELGHNAFTNVYLCHAEQYSLPV
jgi:hypothetical protein